LSWAKFQTLKDGFYQIKMQRQASIKASKKNWKSFTIQSCKRPTKALLKEKTADNSTVKANNKAMLDQVPIKSIEHFDFFLHYNIFNSF
jgi:hypothetical protein